MQFSFEKQKRRHLYLGYSLLFLIAALFVYGTYYITGHALIWHLDGANQHLPLLQHYQKVLKAFLSHPFKPLEQWSWHLGLGGDTFSVYSYYLIGDVFTYLVLFFKQSQLVWAYQLLIMMRLYFAGIAFIYFARHFNQLSTKAIWCGTLVYLFNAYLLYSNVAQPFFTLPFIIFPVIIVQLERVLQGGSAWPLYLAFCWMLISNYYFAYVMGLGAMIFVVVRFLVYYRHEKFIDKLMKLGQTTILALLTSAVMLVPEIYATLNSTRSASQFANGLKVYPLYYYLALPSQLINGGNRDFYFWSALGFCSLAFFALVYIFLQKNYPLLKIIFALSLAMLLLPAFGAIFNGFMAPSNRWTLMLCLPVSLACAILVQNLQKITPKELKVFTASLLGYLAVIALTYYFQSDERLFIPVIFLIIFWAVIYIINTSQVKNASGILLTIVLANVCLNAVYFEAPYNGGYSNEMLDLGSYQRLTKRRYDGLEKDLSTQKDFFRVSTLSQNYFFGADYHMYNALNDPQYYLNSYYSLQNKYVGNFSLIMQNTQYESNIPLGQVSDRTILNDFFGVKYLFMRINQPNAKKIPYGFSLDKMTQQQADPNGKASLAVQTRRYRNQNTFPLLYFQDKVITQKESRYWTASQKERALAKGVYVNRKAALGLERIDQTQLKTQVIKVPYQLISSRGNQVSSFDLEKADKNETYQLVLDRSKLPKNCELHVEIKGIKYTPYTLKKQVEIEQKALTNDLSQGILAQNTRLAYYKYLRYHILQGTPDISYTLTVTSPYGSEKIKQPDQSALSFYKQVSDGTLNLGVFKQKIPNTLTLTLSKLGHYQFSLEVIALPFGRDYQKDVSQIQNHRLKEVKFTTNKVQGKITTEQPGILTSTIPYSKGWEAWVDGKKVAVLKTNHAFVGLKLTKGKHKIALYYRVYGLDLGKKLTLLGLTLALVLCMFEYWLKKRAAS